jgi:hypothetical protein
MEGHKCATCTTKIIGDDARPYCSHCMRDMLPAIRAEVDALRAELARVKAESLRVVKGVPLRLGDIESVPFSEHTNTFTTAGADWRIYAAERRVDESGHRYMMPVSDEWPPIAFGPDTIVQPVRLERWEDE